MPPYVSSPVGPAPKLLVQGVSSYLFGSRATGPTRLLQVTNVALTGNVATLTVLVREGNIPAIGDLITVRGTSSTAGLFNVSNIALASVSITAATGVGTVTFALVHADVVSAPNAGQAYIPVPETGETLANGTSVAVAIPEGNNLNENGITITWSTRFPSAPATCTMTLQASMVDEDSQYQTLDSSTSVTVDLRLITLTRFRFLRVVASNVTGGTLPTAVVRVDI